MARVIGERTTSKHRRRSGRTLETIYPFSKVEVSRIRRRILRWGRANYREYPWRAERDPWLSFLAELLLQRTRASQVEAVFALIKAIADRGGVPPDTSEELQSFVGVGMYTTAAWLSLHAGQRAVIIDANVARWLSRMTRMPYNRDPRHVQWVKELSERLTPRVAFREYNYAVLDFTIGVCTPRNPRCKVCPLCSDCRYSTEEGGGRKAVSLVRTPGGFRIASTRC